MRQCCTSVQTFLFKFLEIMYHNLRITQICSCFAAWTVWYHLTLNVTRQPVLSANSYGTDYSVNVEYVQH